MFAKSKWKNNNIPKVGIPILHLDQIHPLSRVTKIPCPCFLQICSSLMFPLIFMKKTIFFTDNDFLLITYVVGWRSFRLFCSIWWFKMACSSFAGKGRTSRRWFFLFFILSSQLVKWRINFCQFVCLKFSYEPSFYWTISYYVDIYYRWTHLCFSHKNNSDTC